MDWLQCILYGFIMGLGEFIPISSGAQGQILQQIFGAPANDPVRDLVIHICTLIAFGIVWRSPLEGLHRDFQAERTAPRGRGRIVRVNADSRYIRGAVLPMLISMILSIYFSTDQSLPVTAILLVISGIILYLPERMLQGNKTARSMSSMDAMIFGLCSGLGAIPGFSRIGMGLSVSVMRGADRKHALNWAYVLSVSALLLMIGADLVKMIAVPIALSSNFGGYLLFALFSFAGGYLSVFLLRNVIIHRGLHAFSYYAWGAALLLFILYLL